MKRSIIRQTAAALVIAAIAFAGCKKDPAPVKVSGVSLNKTTLALVEGGSETLSATVAPADAENQKTSWKSDKTDVATVDATGNVTAVKAGEAVITVTTDDGAKTAACRVTVKAVFVPVTGITDVPAAATAGVPLTLTGTVAPENAAGNTIVWSISKTGTTGATLTEGNIFNAPTPGTATVTATIAGGKSETEAYTQDFTITVNAGFVAVTGITGVPTNTVAGTPLTLAAIVAPGNATNQTIVWSIAEAGTTGATLTEGNTFNAAAAGTATVRATIANGKSVEEDYTQDISIAILPVPAITAGAQSGELFAGTAGVVTFPLTATGIGNGEYRATVANCPAGVTVGNGSRVSIKNNSGTLSLSGNNTTIAGIYSTLTLSIDGVTSDEFELVISPPKPTAKVGAQVGVLTEGKGGTVTFPVTTTNLADGTYMVTVSNRPTGITEGNLGLVTITGGKGTLTLSATQVTTAGVYSTLTLTINGATSAAFTLTISAEPQIAMTTEKASVLLAVHGSGGIVTFDWGDGTIENRILSTTSLVSYKHTYSTSGQHTITVGGAGLTRLNCEGNELTQINVLRNNSQLLHLDCSNNLLTSIDASGLASLTVLEVLFCTDNQLTSLDVGGFTALKNISCRRNQLTSLDVSGLTALEGLYCDNNQLTILDVRGLTALTQLNCGANGLTALDVSQNTALTYLRCPDNDLTALDVSKNTKLTQFHCQRNQLDAAGLNALFGTLHGNDGNDGNKVIAIKGNPGAGTCNRGIATAKGWNVNTTVDNS